MPLLVDSYSFSDICYKVKYVSKAQKKPSSKLHIIQKIVNISFSIVAGMPLLVDSYSFSDICYKVKYVSKAQKKPSSKLHIIQKIVNILLGITTILKVIHDMLKG